MPLSNVLKQRRAELGLTLLEIAEKMNVSEATVQRWESGNIKSLRQGRIAQLAEILRVSPATLMGWEDKKDPSTEKPIEGVEILIKLYSQMSESQRKAFVHLAEEFLSQGK